MEKTDEEAAVDGAKGTALKDEEPAHELSTPSNKPTTSATIPDVHEKAPEELRTKSQTALIMLALCMALFLAALDMTIIFTAAPTIVAHFQASGAGYLWIGAAYLLACAATVPSWGKISDIFGRKPVLLVANVIFFVGSLICGLAVSMKMLLVGRVLQGVGGGGLISLVSICIGDLFSERNRGTYYGLVGATWGIASAIGPILGGVFSQDVSWRWCFYVNLPCDGLAFLILIFFLDIKTVKTPILQGLKAVDWLGSLTFVGGTIMLLLGLEYGGVTYPWASPTVICLIIFGVATWVLFFFNEWKLAKYAITPIRIFHPRSNIASLAVCFFHGFVNLSAFFFLPVYFQAVLGATPILSGVYLMPLVVSLSFTSVGMGVFIKKTGRYIEPLRICLLLMTLGIGLFINLSAKPDWARIILFQTVLGLGSGPNFMAPLIALQTGVSREDIATATATFSFVRQFSTAISVVIGGVLFQNQMQHYGTQLLRSGVSPHFVSLITGGNAVSATLLVRDLPPVQRTAVRNAYTESLQKTWILFACVGMLGFLVSLLVERRELKKQHETIETGLEAQERFRLKEVARKQAEKNQHIDLEKAEEEKV